jgi:hypothetical protein
VIRSLPAPTPTTRRDACVRAYLRAIARLALEVSDQPELLSDLVAVLRLAPGTIEALRSERRRAA